MKQTLLLILAMCFALAMPAQASEVKGWSPVDHLIGSGSGDVIGPKATDDKVTTCRCMMPQLEAAEVSIGKLKPAYKVTSAAKLIALESNDQGAMHEVGWRRLA